MSPIFFPLNTCSANVFVQKALLLTIIDSFLSRFAPLDYELQK